MDVPSMSITLPFDEATVVAAFSSDLKEFFINSGATSSHLEEVNILPLAASLENSETAASKLQAELQ